MKYVKFLLFSLVFYCLQANKSEAFSFRDSTETPIIRSAAQDQQEAGTVQNRVVVPAVQQYHPSAAKAWVIFQGTGTVTIRANYNVSSITDNGVGDYTINFTTPFSSTNYCVVGMGHHDPGNILTSVFIRDSDAFTTSSVRINTIKMNDAALPTVDSETVQVVVYGDQ